MYSKRTWLNKPDSPSTGNVVAFDGEVKSEILKEVISECQSRIENCDEGVYTNS